MLSHNVFNLVLGCEAYIKFHLKACRRYDGMRPPSALKILAGTTRICILVFGRWSTCLSQVRTRQ